MRGEMTDSETDDGREPARAARSELLELPAALLEPVLRGRAGRAE